VIVPLGLGLPGLADYASVDPDFTIEVEAIAIVDRPFRHPTLFPRSARSREVTHADVSSEAVRGYGVVCGLRWATCCRESKKDIDLPIALIAVTLQGRRGHSSMVKD
jgi:hypothetical protein